MGQWANQKTVVFFASHRPTKTLKSQQEDFKDDQPAKSSLNKRSSSGLGANHPMIFTGETHESKRQIVCFISHHTFKVQKLKNESTCCVCMCVYCCLLYTCCQKGGGEKQHLFSTKVTQKSHLKFKELQGFYSVNLHQKQKYRKITKNTNSRLQIARLWINIPFSFSLDTRIACQWQ